MPWGGGAIGMLLVLLDDRCDERGTKEVVDSLEGATANASDCVGREAATANAMSAEPRNFIAFENYVGPWVRWSVMVQV